MNHILPQSNSLNIQALSRVFNHTTNSYKLLFFRALLSSLEDEQSINIDTSKIVNHMLTHAWVPSVYFKLNLGSQDMVFENLAKLGLVNFDLAHSKGNPYQHLFDTIQNKEKEQTIATLLKYVPYRLLQPFFNEELKGKKDNDKNKLTAELSISNFETVKPLYKIKNSTKNQLIQITLHPEWFDYLIHNLTIVKGWVELNWLQYLQSRNPNTPAISNKLALPLKREALTTQRKFWNNFIKSETLDCLFSNSHLSVDNYELDHFIPWTFVAHNQYWNLIPILNTVNSSKNNKLPAKGETITKYVDIQYSAVKFAKRYNKKTIIEDYIIALQCSESDLFDPMLFKPRFTQIIESLIDSASLQGFEANWRWEKNSDN